MSRFFTLALAGTLAACVGATAWSQSGQSGGGAGASGGANTAGQAGTAGTAGTAGAAGQAGTAGTTGRAGAAGQVSAGGVQTGTSATAPGQAGITPPLDRNFNNFNNFGVGQRPFFADPRVRQELGLTDDQFNRLNQAFLNSRRGFNQGVTGLGNNLTEQQRAQQMMQLQNRFNQQFSGSLDTTFTDPRMRTRFNQLSFQFQGPAAFNDPMIQQRLNLTPQQQRRFRQLSTEWRQQLQRLRRAGRDADPQISQQQFLQLQQQLQQQMLAVLTPQQQQTWNQLVGQPFAFPQTTFFDEEPPANPLDRTRRGVPIEPRTTGNVPQGNTTQGGGVAPRGGTAQGTQNQGGQGTIR